MRVRLLLIAALLFAGSAHADTVTYKLTITNNWTRAAHPIGYPDIAHFSWLGGGTHASPSDFWSLGGTATPGFELLAESGDTREWVSELEAAGAVPLEWRHWFCPPQQSNPNCGSLSVSFQVSSDEPYLTLASMLGPSPDWFVGVQDLSLRPNGEWASNFSVPLVLNDAGTEGGTTPILDNPPTAEPIQRIAYNSNTGDYVPSNQLFFVGQLDFELLTEPPTEGATRLVSATPAGEGGNGTSWDPAVSADGNLVAFSSDATTLVANDQNGSVRDVFIYNRSTGELRNLTNGGNGASEDPVLSKDGRWLAFVTRATNLPTNVPDTNADVADIVLLELATGELNLITAGANAPSRSPSISGDGVQVVFDSQATNLGFSVYLPEGCENDPTSTTLPCFNNVLHYDRIRDVTVVLTQVGTTDSRAPSISESGLYASYISEGFGGVIAMNLDTGERTALPLGLALDTLRFSRPAISASGRWVAIHSAPANGPTELHLYDRANDTAHVIGEASQLPGQFSSDERYLVYSSTASNPDGTDPNGNIRDIFRVDLSTPAPFTSRRITAGGNEGSGGPVISGDGGVVVWDSQASNFVDDFNGDLFDVFLREVSVDPVNTNQPPTADAQSLTVDAGDALAITLTGSDSDGDTLDFEVVAAPNNGVLSGVPPNLTYIANAGFAGTDSFTFAVSDGVLSSAAAAVEIGVVAVNAEPVAVSQSLTIPAASTVAITLSGSDADNQPLSFAIVELPSNGALTGTLPNLLYTPLNGFAGVDNFTFTVSDGTSTSAVATVSISVSEPTGGGPQPGGNPPTANAQSVSTPAQTPLSVVLTGSSANGDPLSYNFVSLPASGALSGQAPNLVYTPDSNFVGADGFVFTVSDVQGTSAPVAVSIRVTDPGVALLAAVLPASRSVAVGTTATAFATLINTGLAVGQGCAIVPPDDLAAEFFYQVTDPATNEALGSRNAPILIPAGGAQSFIFGITPSEEIVATDVALDFRCINSISAASFVGLNTLLLSASVTPGPDLIALAATVSNDGVMELNGNNGFFTASTINVGSTATISVSVDTGEASLPMSLSLCETDPLTSICINPTQPSTDPVVVEIAEGGSPTFAVFANSSDFVALDPANSRIFLRFSDEAGEVKGATSVAVRSVTP